MTLLFYIDVIYMTKVLVIIFDLNNISYIFYIFNSKHFNKSKLYILFNN